MKVLILVMAGLVTIAMEYRVFVAAPGMDFDHYYAAAQMLRSGSGARLYDVHLQDQFEAKYTHRSGTLFNYPAATALLYLPVTLGNFYRGYFLWESLSLTIVFGCIFLLNRSFALFRDTHFIALLSLFFVPLHTLLLEGQVDAFVLLAYVLALLALKSEQPFAAGVVLALGLVKFHLVLPFAWVMLVRKQWRFLYGFSAGSIFVIALSVSICPSFLTSYPRLLATMQSLPNGGFHPQLMSNFRGLIYLATKHEAPVSLLAAIALVVLTIVARRWTTLESGFSAAIAATLFSTYHVYVPDLVLLLIPLMFACRPPWNLEKTLVLLFLALPLVPYFLTVARVSALLAIPMFVLVSARCYSARPAATLLNTPAEQNAI
jgi:hypothetical protein